MFLILLASYQAFGEVALLCNIPQPFAVTVTELCQVRWCRSQLGFRSHLSLSYSYST